MGHPVKIFAALLLLFSFSFISCEDLDVSGMFRSYDPVNERFEQSMEWNASHPFRVIPVPADEYTIFSMGDSHVGPTKNLDAFFRDAKTKNAAAVVMVGDLTTGYAEDYEVFQQHVPDPDSLTSFYIVGNHDLYFNGWNQFFPRFGSSTYYFSVETGVDSDLFICLDTGGGTLGNKQLDWLKDILKNIRPNYRNCLGLIFLPKIM